MSVIVVVEILVFGYEHNALFGHTFVALESLQRSSYCNAEFTSLYWAITITTPQRNSCDKGYKQLVGIHAQHYSNELFLLDDHRALRLGFCGRPLNFNESEVLNSRPGTSVHANKGQTHTATRREYMFSTSNPSMRRSLIIVFFSASLSIWPVGLEEEVHKHICYEKKILVSIATLKMSAGIFLNMTFRLLTTQKHLGRWENL